METWSTLSPYSLRWGQWKGDNDVLVVVHLCANASHPTPWGPLPQQEARHKSEHPKSCGVWGKLFTVLAKGARA